MLHHLSLPVSDLGKSGRFYDAVLGALGYRRVWEIEGGIGYGWEDEKDKLAIFEKDEAKAAGEGFHVAFAAHSRAEVDSFYEAGLACGGRCNGAPGLRENYGADYYATFLLDPDGHRLEAVYKGRS